MVCCSFELYQLQLVVSLRDQLLSASFIFLSDPFASTKLTKDILEVVKVLQSSTH